jgi:tetratricopeptide (TPR) repeat protein
VTLAQLPAPVAGFTGRETELADVTGLLDPAAGGGAVVVSAVAGLAGVGKTALAIQAAHAARTAGWFGGGVLFMDLHGYDDQVVQPAEALDALLRALGIPIDQLPQGTEARAGLYRSALATINDPVLIVLDNASSEAQIRALLPGDGPHRALITSRDTLAGLSARLMDIEVLDEPTAVTLLEEVLRAARPGDARIIDDPDAARQLAEVCGGLPLALRITAALLTADPTLTAAELAEQLADQVRRLENLHYDDGGGSNAPSVAVAFDLSYRHLDPVTAKLFRLLPVNPGPDVSTAAVAALAGQPVNQTRVVLGRLTRAHLIEPSGIRAGRWRMHDLLRLYALQLIATEAQVDELEQARTRLLEYYLNQAGAADAHLRGSSEEPTPERFSDRLDALAWLDAERSNLIAATVMAATFGVDNVAQSLPRHLAEYLYFRQRADESRTVQAIRRDISRRLGDKADEAAALTRIGMALGQVGRFEEAITTQQDALLIAQTIGDRSGEASALNNLGIALVEVRRFADAITALRNAATICQMIGNRISHGVVLTSVGAALQVMGRFEEAITTLHDAIASLRETSDRFREGVAVNCLGAALQEVGRFGEAITIHQDALTIFREVGDRNREGAALNSLGVALQEVGRFEEAIAAHQDALAIFQEVSDRTSEGIALNNLGIALREVGRRDEAIAAKRDAAAIYKAIGGERGEGSLMMNLKDDRARKGS